MKIVFPNGTSAMDAKVKEGDVFWVPRYFPFCQTASRSGPFEFFGFTTSTTLPPLEDFVKLMEGEREEKMKELARNF